MSNFLWLKQIYFYVAVLNVVISFQLQAISVDTVLASNLTDFPNQPQLCCCCHQLTLSLGIVEIGIMTPVQRLCREAIQMNITLQELFNETGSRKEQNQLVKSSLKQLNLLSDWNILKLIKARCVYLCQELWHSRKLYCYVYT